MQELDGLFRNFSKSWLAEYMDLTLDATTKWRTRQQIPYNKLKRIVEYLEMHNDDCITVCWHIMEEYNRMQMDKIKAKENKLLLRKQNKWKQSIWIVKNVESK